MFLDETRGFMCNVFGVYNVDAIFVLQVSAYNLWVVVLAKAK